LQASKSIQLTQRITERQIYNDAILRSRLFFYFNTLIAIPVEKTNTATNKIRHTFYTQPPTRV